MMNGAEDVANTRPSSHAFDEEVLSAPLASRKFLPVDFDRSAAGKEGVFAEKVEEAKLLPRRLGAESALAEVRPAFDRSGGRHFAAT